MIQSRVNLTLGYCTGKHQRDQSDFFHSLLLVWKRLDTIKKAVSKFNGWHILIHVTVFVEDCESVIEQVVIRGYLRLPLPFLHLMVGFEARVLFRVTQVEVTPLSHQAIVRV